MLKKMHVNFIAENLTTEILVPDEMASRLVAIMNKLENVSAYQSPEPATSLIELGKKALASTGGKTMSESKKKANAERSNAYWARVHSGELPAPPRRKKGETKKVSENA